MNRSAQLVILTILLRILIVEISCIELHRSLAMLLCFGLVIIDRCVSLLQFVSKTNSATAFCQAYTQFYIIFGVVKRYVHQMLYILLALVFWSIVCMVFILVKYMPTLDFGPIYFFTLVYLVTALVMGLSGLELLCDMCHKAVTVVIIQRMRTKLRCAYIATKENKIKYLRIKAIYPVRLRYGFFGNLDIEFVAEFCNALCIRCCESVVVFDYKEFLF